MIFFTRSYHRFLYAVLRLHRFWDGVNDFLYFRIYFSYTFSQVKIHTYALVYDDKYFLTYNNQTSLKDNTLDSASIQESIGVNSYFYVGYVIY